MREERADQQQASQCGQRQGDQEPRDEGENQPGFHDKLPCAKHSDLKASEPEEILMRR